MKKKKSELKIQTITYSRLKNLGDYENERVELTIQVPIGTDPIDALREAKYWVANRLHIDFSGSYDRKYSIQRNNSNHGPVCVCDDCM